ncbi:MAG TPA: cobyric acid synthase [Acidimicrobiales bacterium]|nr:cobyric acid synthase [Acidimicrobiales bacterium]HLN43906.1 cobyric acid synthase [Acidimicrobiales bacterium]
MTGGLLVAGTSSGAGKSTLVAGLCRWCARSGISVAPFKAQNMSLNSFVTRGGDEIGRAQAAQAQAARIEPEAVMNPVLLKPGTDSRSQVVVLGRPAAEMDAHRYWSDRGRFLDVVVESYQDLRSRFDVVICEGAGSPAEINLRAFDIVNLGFARAVGVPVVVVADIDRGGMFASLVGTLALLEHEDQRQVQGFVVNRFRGDRSLLQPGLETLRALTGRSTLGVLPHVEDLWIDEEDRPDPAAYRDAGAALGDEVLRVAVVRLPRSSNLTDFDPLAAEPGVIVRFASRPEEIFDADLVVVPGTRATVEDLSWLRSRGIDKALVKLADADRPILGICGGYQMLGVSIDDPIESRRGTVEGLGLLPVHTTFGADKVLGRPSRTLPEAMVVEGYEIHHGVVSRSDGSPLFADVGCRVGSVAGTPWHGLFENDGFRRSFLTETALRAGRAFAVCPDTNFGAIRETRFEKLANMVADHMDTDSILRIIDGHTVEHAMFSIGLGGPKRGSPMFEP